MKKYTFTVPATTKTNSNFYTVKYNKKSDSENLKDYLIDNAIEKYPWLGGNTYNTYTIKPTYKITKPKYTYTEFYDTYTFNDLLDLMMGYGKKIALSDLKDEYDYKINGTPIRIYSDRIQVGYKFFSLNDYRFLDSDMKKTIYNIYININL